jgi:hypothetical protein
MLTFENHFAGETLDFFLQINVFLHKTKTFGLALFSLCCFASTNFDFDLYEVSPSIFFTFPLSRFMIS